MSGPFLIKRPQNCSATEETQVRETRVREAQVREAQVEEAQAKQAQARAPSQETGRPAPTGKPRSVKPPEQTPSPAIPTRIGTVDIEQFSRNLARLVEEGGRALAAYLRPREEGRDDNELADEVTEVAKTLGEVAEYWLSDPQRTVELQTSLGKAYLDLWASAVRRLAG